MALLAPIPTQAPLLQTGPDGKPTEYLASEWYQWLFFLTARLQVSPQVLGTPTGLATQSASIATTALNMGALTSGVYRVSYYARITRAASVSSSLTITIGWSDGGVAQTNTSAAATGNTTATTLIGSIVIHSDALAITYATTYASVGGTPMQYSLSVIPELLA